MALPQRNDFNNGAGTSRNSFKRRRDSYGSETVDYLTTTEMEQEEFSFLWTLKKYSTLRAVEELFSPVFLGGRQSHHRWKIILRNDSMYGMQTIGLRLLLVEFGDGIDYPFPKIIARFQFSLLDAEGRPWILGGSPSMIPVDFEKNKAWAFDHVFLMTVLLNNPQKLVNNDTLKIHLRVWIHKGVKHQFSFGGNSIRANEDELQDYRRMKMLSFQMGNIFNENVMTDIKIRTGTETFEAHKAVLAGRSPVFAAMLTLGPNEEPPTEIIIEGFDNVVVRDMLQYVYTGEAKLLGERANDLLRIAEKYNLAELKDGCETMLANKLTIDNAGATLLLAQKNKADVLKFRVIEFISRNSNVLKENQKFKDVLAANPNLAMELYLQQ